MDEDELEDEELDEALLIILVIKIYQTCYYHYILFHFDYDFDYHGSDSDEDKTFADETFLFAILLLGLLLFAGADIIRILDTC